MAGSTTASDDDEEYVKGILQLAKDKALAPLHAALSKPARRAYIQTALLLLATGALFATALAAYSIFYYAYVPTRGFSVPVHLQFDYASPPAGAFAPGAAGGGVGLLSAKHPWGAATGLRKWLVSEQPYDVRVELDMPRTRANREAGNFMLGVKLWGPPGAKSGGATVGDGISAFSLPGDEAGAGGGMEEVVLASSSRPAILTWRSDVVENVGKAVGLPWYVLGWRKEAERLVVGVMEGVRFERGSWKYLPDKVSVEVRSAERLQIYGCWVVFEAKLGGLRYVFPFPIFSGDIPSLLLWMGCWICWRLLLR
ncbi:putative adipose-regulatory protein-domain-containing protein [Macrophomina phaseolina]|uniref:Adipose-regulatory protein-domain-containing protein n=1 Tax=Macrophomina phaseolina TaxID=35725 RepID=A0ABQ8G897_9PEZI|nr:putative adipose-regulatory protein-domain-containing protein [Macrophomina phaseolina]